MLLNVTLYKGGGAMHTLPNWPRQPRIGASNNPPGLMTLLVIFTFGLCSFISRAESHENRALLTTAPIALDDEFNGVEDTPMTLVGITANDIDDDGVINITSIDLDPTAAGQQTTISNSHGTYSLTVASAEITFVPTNDWNGTTSLAYTVQDNEGNTSNVAFIIITILPVTDMPTAIDDYAVGSEDDPYIDVAMVQNNDFDPEGQGFIVGSIDINPITLEQDTYYEDANGTWIVDLGNGTISFFPNANFHGSAMIGYTIVGFTNLLSNVAFVFVDVLPVNDAPVAVTNSVVIPSGNTGLLPNILANDLDLENNIHPETIDLDPYTPGQQTTKTTTDGTWSVNLALSHVTFIAEITYSGSTSISYTVQDSLGLESNEANLTAHVIGTNFAPTAFGDSASGLEDAAYIDVVAITSNDTDPNGAGQLLISTIDIDPNTNDQQILVTTSEGDWSLDTLTGTVRYVPIANFNGIADIWYTLKDVGGLASAPAHITVSVSPDDDNPLTAADSAITNMAVPCIIYQILANDYDLETTLDPATVDLNNLNAGIQHTFTNDAGQWDYIVADENVQFTPAANFSGIARIEYVVQDSGGSRSLPADLVVTVLSGPPPNSTPWPNQAQFAVVSSLDNIQIPADSWSSTWVDINGDGWEDLFVSDKSVQSSNSFFLNNAGHDFELINTSVFDNSTTTLGSLWADYDKDGDNDVILVHDGLVAPQFYRNNGNGDFLPVPNSGFSANPQFNLGAASVDFDNDGYLDVFFSNYHENRTHELYRNQRDGTFQKVTGTSLSSSSESALGSLWCDYDDDGLQDLFIPNNENQNNSLYHNNGDGTFQKITSGAIVNDGGQSVGACWGDYDRDGDMDLFVANASDQDNFLYANDGHGTFTKITNSIVTSDGGHSHGCAWIDIDNDADLDLYVTNDVGYKFLYVNDGTGQFFRKTNEPIVQNFGNAFGQSWSDFDRDGDLDLYVSTHSNEQNRVFVNSGSPYNWIQIKLRGTNSNTNAIGAKIRIKANGFWQTTQVSSQCGFNGQHSQFIHFGLGTAASIDSLEVNWPSGIHQVWTDQGVNQFLTMTETNMATIHGVAYFDSNFNCQRDSEETVLAHMPILINGGEFSVRTDAQGQYAVPLGEGNFNFTGGGTNYWESECPGIDQLITDNGNQHQVDVPFIPTAFGYDLGIALVGLEWERNSTKQSTLTYMNSGTVDAFDTEIAVTYPAGVSIIDASLPWSYMDGQTYYWSLGTVPSETSVSITLIDAISSEAAIGETLSIRASIQASNIDLFTNNNQAQFDREIVSQGTANIIRVTPKGEGEPGYIERDQELTYKIQFQNVGTHAANNIRIENTLPPNLDIQSLEIIAASNNYSYVITDDRHITIFFNDINLTNASLSQLESQGVIMYRIKPLVSAPAGEQIENKATMYFDYADPVTTNGVQNTLKSSANGVSPGVMLWPNPTNDIIHIGLNQSQIQFEDRSTLELVEIIDSKGQIVNAWNKSGLYQLDFNTLELQAGAYQVRIIDQNGKAYAGRFLVTKGNR